MCEAIAEKVRGLPTIVINRTFELAPWADVLYAADSRFWRNWPGAVEFAGLKVSVEPTKNFAYGDPPPKGVKALRVTGITGFDPDPSCIRTGYNSGYQALHFVVHTGAARVLLCGYDMRGTHWHAPHPMPLANPNPAALVDWCILFQQLAPLIADRLEVINCTPDSALTCFRYVPLGEVLQ